jgi:acetate kinase
LVAQTLPVPSGEESAGTGSTACRWEWAVSTLGAQLGENAVIAHLGSGSSPLRCCRTGHDTTMGLTPIGSLMMSSRSGDDSGALST